MMTRPLPLFLALFGASFALADEFSDQFEALEKAGDAAAIAALIEKGATAELDNPEYYAIAGNYWWRRASAVGVPALKAGDYELDAGDLTITDPKTGKKVGALGKAGKGNPELPKRALKTLSDGAKKFPARADIALGLAHVQKELGLHEGYVETLSALLAEAKKGEEKLRWTKGAALPKPAGTFLPETVQQYTASLFRTNTPATDALCGKLLSAVTDAFPDHPYAYNLQAALADANGKPNEAVSKLETAHEKAPADSMVLSNLAGAYAKVGQSEKAIAAYEKVLTMEINSRSRQKAEAALAELKAEK